MNKKGAKSKYRTPDEILKAYKRNRTSKTFVDDAGEWAFFVRFYIKRA